MIDPGSDPPGSAETWPSIEGYELTGHVGAGGFGDVYDGRRIADGLRVAIKVARRDRALSAERLKRELAALQDIGPPFVPAVVGAGDLADGPCFIAMEYVALPTLERWLSSSTLASPAVFLECARAILAAVGATHRASYVHRDLTPKNIFIGEAPWRAKLFDFGLALDRRRSEARRGAATTSGTNSATLAGTNSTTLAGTNSTTLAGTNSTTLAGTNSTTLAGTNSTEILTAAGTLLGTAAYMAPEQCEGAGEIDTRADIYALGVVFYRMLSGRLPFAGSAGEVVRAHLNLRPPPLRCFGSEPSGPLSAVILRCLAKRPESRYPDVAALEGALAAACARSDPARPSSTRLATSSATPAPPSRSSAIPLVFFSSDREPLAIQRALTHLGGELVHAARNRFVVAFLPERSSDPLGRAIAAGRALIDRAFCSGALIDIAPVTIVPSAGGSMKVLSPLFLRPGSYPSNQAGLQLSPEAEAQAHLQEAPGTIPLLGRSEAISSLDALLHRAIDENAPTVAVVIGEAGLGKTALASALTERLDRAPMAAGAPGPPRLALKPEESAGKTRPRLLALKAEESAGEREPLLRSLLEALIGPLPTSAPSDRGRSLLTDRLRLFGEWTWAAIALRLGWLDLSDPILAGPSLVPGALRSLVSRATGEALRAQALAEGGLFVLVDDAHWADPTTLDALEYATLSDGSAPLAVCIIARPALERARSDLGRRASRHLHLRLDVLDPENARELCRRLLHPARNVPTAALDALVARTQGVPFLIVELVRHLKQAGLVRRERDGGRFVVATDELSDGSDIPLLDWLAARELSALPPEIALHAQLAALLGADSSLEEIDGVVAELDKAQDARLEFDPEAAFRQLEQRGILVPAGDPRRRLFRHALLREAIARSTPPPLTKAIHEASARYYRCATDLPDQLRRNRLAGHAEASGDLEEAATLHRSLAAEALARHAYLDAERAFGKVIELDACRAPSEPDLEACRGRGIARYRLGRFGDALADFASARSIAQRLQVPQIEADLLLDEAMALDWLNDPALSKARLEEAEEVLRSCSGPRPANLEARLSLARGRTFWRHGRSIEARAELERAASSAEKLGLDGYETRIAALLMLGKILPGLDASKDAERILDRVIAECRARGDDLHLAAALNNRTSVWFAQKAEEKAAQDLTEFIRIGRELGMTSIEEVGEYNLAVLRFREGRFDRASDHLARVSALVEEREPGDAFRAAVLLLDARLALLQGELERARAVQAKLRSEEHARNAAGGTSFLPNFRLTFLLIDLMLDRATPAAWDALEREAAGFPSELAEILELRGLSSYARGARSEAESHLEHALVTAERVASPLRLRIARTLERWRSGGPPQ